MKPPRIDGDHRLAHRIEELGPGAQLALGPGPVDGLGEDRGHRGDEVDRRVVEVQRLAAVDPDHAVGARHALHRGGDVAPIARLVEDRVVAPGLHDQVVDAHRAPLGQGEGGEGGLGRRGVHRSRAVLPAAGGPELQALLCGQQLQHRGAVGVEDLPEHRHRLLEEGVGVRPERQRPVGEARDSRGRARRLRHLNRHRCGPPLAPRTTSKGRYRPGGRHHGSAP